MKNFYSYLIVLLMVGYSFSQTSKQKEHDLFVMPTAFTLEKGELYFTDYELFFLNLGFAPTSSTHLSVLSLFPITTQALESFSLGVKQNLVNQNRYGIAVFGSYTPKFRGYTIGGIVSLIPSSNLSLHFGLGLMGDTDTNGLETLYMGGLKIEITQRSALIAEYTNFETAIENDFKGFINLGIRFRSKRLMIDFGGFRPLESSSDLFLFPFLKGTIIIGRK